MATTGRAPGGGVEQGSFGVALAALRRGQGWRQIDLVEALGHGVARPTIANVEAGRERPSEALFALLEQFLPDWAAQLEVPFRQARDSRAPRPRGPAQRDKPSPLGGPFQLEQLTLVYLFRHARVPEEIVEIRRVKALRAGVHSYGLKLRSETDDLDVEEELLYGGRVTEGRMTHTPGASVYLRRVDFGRPLRRGQRHEFAMRTWEDRGADPDTEVRFDLTIPTDSVALHLNFLGPETPREVWHFGPLPDVALTPKSASEATPVAVHGPGPVSAYFERPEPGMTYGMGWSWPV